jgi:hypothetical protein
MPQFQQLGLANKLRYRVGESKSALPICGIFSIDNHLIIFSHVKELLIFSHGFGHRIDHCFSLL